MRKHRVRWETATIKKHSAKSEIKNTEHVYGAAAIAQCFKDVDFPISKKQGCKPTSISLIAVGHA